MAHYPHSLSAADLHSISDSNPDQVFHNPRSNHGKSDLSRRRKSRDLDALQLSTNVSDPVGVAGSGDGDAKTTPRPFSVNQALVSLLLETPSPYNTVSGAGDGVGLSKELLAQEEYAVFLEHLLSTPLSSLPSEPMNLAARHAQISAQLADLTHEHFPAILSAHDSVISVSSGLDHMERFLDEFPAALDGVSSSISDFLSQATAIAARRDRVALVLDHLPTLTDLLEAPQLLQTLARNGHYDEALDLQQHIERIRMRAPDSTVVKVVAEEVSSLSRSTLLHLLAQLRQPTPLATSIRLVGHLRRAAILPDHALRVSWLASRWGRFVERVNTEAGGTLARHPTDEAAAAEFVRKYVDIAREEILDAIAQYRAIFPETSTNAPIGGAQPATISSILPTFVLIFTSHHRSHLLHYLPRISDLAQLASLHAHASYLGLSLARLGADVRTPTGSVWENRVGEVVEHHFREGARSISEALEKAGPDGLMPRPGGGDGLPLPIALLNLCLSIYNQLRHIAFVALVPRLALALTAAVAEVAWALLQCGEKLHMGDSPHEVGARDAYRATAKELAGVVIPKVVEGFEKGVFGSVAAGKGVAGVVDTKAVMIVLDKAITVHVSEGRS
ncbi:Dor1-domain-containing protein [Gonapodya prolifera JEL478]|uniref:Conserved oligomeric Golgi complex subunit 8 n=1 Tax=Gonapodya prolifera (strain JEL478) TaxID=1344416 RepID=A0A139AH84_GONPJ|nr:Dor1-domain-containing protein [Gonapodya prolifera JEL478]|eukprot:KXS16147.1 Dor1-domain-containing protein [Gonapodya prolifera JEL478]